jgi:nucleoid-associated protein YgaU
MPPRRYSRYSFCSASKDDAGRLVLSERVPFRFRVLSDTVQYTCKEGDSLYVLAHRAYKGLPRPSGLWWIIADFQPDPIFDPTVVLTPGQVLFIPSLRTVQELVFAESRRYEDDSI